MCISVSKRARAVFCSLITSRKRSAGYTYFDHGIKKKFNADGPSEIIVHSTYNTFCCLLTLTSLGGRALNWYDSFKKYLMLRGVMHAPSRDASSCGSRTLPPPPPFSLLFLSPPCSADRAAFSQNSSILPFVDVGFFLYLLSFGTKKKAFNTHKHTLYRLERCVIFFALPKFKYRVL